MAVTVVGIALGVLRREMAEGSLSLSVLVVFQRLWRLDGCKFCGKEVHHSFFVINTKLTNCTFGCLLM